MFASIKNEKNTWKQFFYKTLNKTGFLNIPIVFQGELIKCLQIAKKWIAKSSRENPLKNEFKIGKFRKIRVKNLKWEDLNFSLKSFRIHIKKC